MDFTEVNGIIEKIKTMSDAEVNIFIDIAKEKGLTKEPDELRISLESIRKKTD